MWKRNKPAFEYVIQSMRRLTEDKDMKLKKTDAQRKANAIRAKIVQAAMDEDALWYKPNTWSANMPAYAYTELCPDPDYRR